MRKLIQCTILSLLVFNTTSLLGQSNAEPIKVLVGDNLNFIQDYFNEMKSRYFANNPHIISSGTTRDGNLILEFGAPTIGGEEKANCLNIKTTFVRVNGGDEICVEQLIFGTQKSAYSNLLQIKDSFTSKGGGIWEQEYNDTFVLIAEYRKAHDSDFYSLRIYLKSIN